MNKEKLMKRFNCLLLLLALLPSLAIAQHDPNTKSINLEIGMTPKQTTQILGLPNSSSARIHEGRDVLCYSYKGSNQWLSVLFIEGSIVAWRDGACWASYNL